MADIELVIKIDENAYRRIQALVMEDYYKHDIYRYSMRRIANGTPIPDNATNGKVIMAMFPNVNVYEHNGGATYSVNNEYNFNATWWNAPYQKGGK